MRRVRGEQDIIVRYARERAIETLPALLASREDRRRLLELATRLMADPRLHAANPTAEQLVMLEELRRRLGSDSPPVARAPQVRTRNRSGVRTPKARRREASSGARSR